MSKSKRVDTSDINTGYVISYADKSTREAKPDPMPMQVTEPASAPTEKPELETAVVETITGTEPAEEPVQETATVSVKREPSKRKRGQVDTYDDVFLKRKELKTRQSVYISQEIHVSIARLVHVLALAGKEISVGGYIDNVLAEHMESHKEVIADLFRQQLDKFL